jgi:hypothetical protein
MDRSAKRGEVSGRAGDEAMATVALGWSRERKREARGKGEGEQGRARGAVGLSLSPPRRL